MHIKRLEIDNFKSFANKSEIPFLTGFTAIAGINGSGKSNIIDSILFTLGLSSARALRSEKGIADLISTHNKRNEAYVKVVFDLDDDNGTEISFARRVKKTNQGYQSIYYINDKPSRTASTTLARSTRTSSWLCMSRTLTLPAASSSPPKTRMSLAPTLSACLN